jgi:leucyl aminopeptidase
MIKIIESIDLREESRPLIVGLNKEVAVFKELDSLLNGGLASLDAKYVIPSLKLIKAPKIYVFKGEDLAADFTELAALEGEYVILLDTFTATHSIEEVAKVFGEVIMNKSSSLNLKSEPKEVVHSFMVYSACDMKKALNEGIVLGESINFVRRLVDLPNNYLNAEKLARFAVEKTGNLKNVTVEILNKKALQDLKMGAFLGVNQGSYDEPRLIAIKYQGKETWDDPVCFIGKGVTFDTGGYSLKQSMINMKGDMAGGAAVIGAAYAVATLELPVNALFLVGATDNRMGEYAIVPDDILTSMSGKTIEIVSTDAEGRLVLADVLTYAQSQGAKKLIDIATLTGSMAATFGGYYSGAFANDQEFYDKFAASCKNAKEKVWQMPLDDCFFEIIKSKIADMKNSSGRNCGAASAAIFLKQFVSKDSKWIHLDIAGTSSVDGNATGVMVKSFVEFCK